MSRKARIKLTGSIGGKNFSSFITVFGGVFNDNHWLDTNLNSWLGTNLGSGHGQHWVHNKHRDTILLKIDKDNRDPNDPDSELVITHTTAAQLNLDGRFWVVFPFDVGQTGQGVVFSGQGLPSGLYDYEVVQVT